jgi:hypothetical protein
VSQQEERCSEERDRDDDPDALLKRIVGIEPVDLRQTDCSQQTGNREQIRVCLYTHLTLPTTPYV